MRLLLLGGSSRDSAAETCFSALDKAIKTHRLYDGRGELCVKTVENFFEQADQYLQNNDKISFEISGQGFKHNERVLSAEDRTGQGYFQMFKDGLRQLTLVRGLDHNEAQKLIVVLATRQQSKKSTNADDELSDFEEDTVTRLWDSNFKSIRYEAIDSFVEGDVYVPELKKKMSLAQWVNTKMEDYGEEKIDEWQRIGPPLKAAKTPPGVPERALIGAEPTKGLPSGGIQAFREQYETDQSTQMERFSVVWGQLVQQASQDDVKVLMQLMIGLINDWMDEGNWPGLLRTFQVLRKLAKQENFKSLVNIIVQECASPAGLQRLKPHVQDLHPRSAVDALRFHLLLGRPGLETLCKMLADVEPGPIIQAFEMAFKKAKVNPMGMYLARMRSREPHPVIDSTRKLAPMASHPMVLKALRHAVQREERQIRNAALAALRGDKDPATITGLGRALFDPEPKIRGAAIRALARTPHAIGRTALMERIKDKEFRALPSEERKALMKSLVKLPDVGVWELLTDLLSKNRVFGGKNIRAIQQEIREILRQLNDPEAMRILGEKKTSAAEAE